jgi:hypothetical protein
VEGVSSLLKGHRYTAYAYRIPDWIIDTTHRVRPALRVLGLGFRVCVSCCLCCLLSSWPSAPEPRAPCLLPCSPLSILVYDNLLLYAPHTQRIQRNRNRYRNRCRNQARAALCMMPVQVFDPLRASIFPHSLLHPTHPLSPFPLPSSTFIPLRPPPPQSCPCQLCRQRQIRTGSRSAPSGSTSSWDSATVSTLLDSTLSTMPKV